MNLLKLVKPGDWLVLLSAMLIVVWLFNSIWQSNSGDRVIVRSGGKIIAETSLFQEQTIHVNGPLGTSIIAIQNHRARIASDPSPRQYCVKQGWLSRSGESAICLPNQVSLEITGAKKLYDSLTY